MADPRLEQLLQDIETLVDAKVTDRLNQRPHLFDTQAVSLSLFERNYMSKHDGNEWINQDFFRSFLRWLELYYAYHLDADTDNILNSIEMSHLAGVLYTPPEGAELTGMTSILDLAFNDINTLIGTLASVESDLSGLLSDMSTAQGNISTLQGNYSSLLSAFNTHAGTQNIHLAPDGTSLYLKNVSQIGIVDSYVRGLISGTAPIVVSAGGVISLSIDPATLSVNGSNQLTVIGGGGGGTTEGLSFDTETNVLSIISGGGSSTVDLSSLISGGADLSNYVKKTGETAQTINGNITVTGSITAGGEITAWGADYAEMFEWADGNKKDDHRLGLMVSVDRNGKINKFQPIHPSVRPDGVVSVNPSVIGNNPIEWPGKYRRSNIGTIYKDENGDPAISNEYDPTQEYIPRTKRREWATVGLIGRLRVYVDMEDSEKDALMNDFVIPAYGGKVRFANHVPNYVPKYKVIKRIGYDIVEILFR